LVERIAVAFEMFLDRHGHFFRTRTRYNVAVAPDGPGQRSPA
jgi:hypothetical protein